MIDGYQQLSRECRGWKVFSEFWADIQQQMQIQLQYSLEKQLVSLQQDYLACGYHQRADRREALQAFGRWRRRWGKRYPDAVGRLQGGMEQLLAFFPCLQRTAKPWGLPT